VPTGRADPPGSSRRRVSPSLCPLSASSPPPPSPVPVRSLRSGSVEKLLDATTREAQDRGRGGGCPGGGGKPADNVTPRQAARIESLVSERPAGLRQVKALVVLHCRVPL
jgi:hypothetical protein